MNFEVVAQTGKHGVSRIQRRCLRYWNNRHYSIALVLLLVDRCQAYSGFRGTLQTTTRVSLERRIIEVQGDVPGLLRGQHPALSTQNTGRISQSPPLCSEDFHGFAKEYALL